MKLGILLGLSCLLACGSGGDPGFNDSGTDKDGGVTNNDAGPPGPDGSTNKDSSAGCGTCPTGYSCGKANGVSVCRNVQTQIPLFSNVYVILMENTSLSTLQSAITAGTAPTLKNLQTSYASASDYHGVAHPSLPNYVALTSGDTQGIGCDCKAAQNQGSCNIATCNLLLGSCSCDKPVTGHLADQLEAANKTWMDFGEDMGTPCNLTDSGNYAVRHNPFLYYDNVQTNATRCAAHVVDFTSFNPASPAAFNFIAPNLVDDMHNPDPVTDAVHVNIPQGDTWLGPHLGAILASSAYKQGGLLVVVWDEDDGSGGITGTDDPIGMFLMSPYAKAGGYTSPVHADHYSLLATFEDGLALSRIGKASGATPLTDFFPSN